MNEVAAAGWLDLAPPLPSVSLALRAFRRLAANLKASERCPVEARSTKINHAIKRNLTSPKVAPQHAQILRAASLVLGDLARQGWQVKPAKRGARVRPPDPTTDREVEKIRVRAQESVKRDQQLRTPSVTKFIQSMERRRLHDGEGVSIFSLMRDGQDLAKGLQKARNRSGEARVAAIQALIDPYLQFVTPTDRCEQTGLRLQDIWRYFRHTWTTPYESTPGRSMMFIVRDRAAPFHPVIGIGALCSPIVQLGQRDRWLEWDADTFLEKLSSNPSARVGRWLVATTDKAIADIDVLDFIESGLITRGDLRRPTLEVIAALRKEAATNAKTHKDLSRAQDLKRARAEEMDSRAFWRARSRSRLFKWRRAALLADLLVAREALQRLLGKKPSVGSVKAMLGEPAGVRAVRFVVRKARGDRVGIAMADISVCGAIAPYNAILGGKLVSMLAVGPQVVDAYRERYRAAESEIASAIAGRAIVRPSELVFMGTTSLYGLGSSQYNRIRIPAERIGGAKPNELRFHEIGKSEAFGSSHLSEDALTALADLTSHLRSRHEVRNVFGEGVSPRMRKARHGLELLGFPANDLLRHGRKRIIYGVLLAENAREYLLGMATRPIYIAPVRQVLAASSGIASWWIERWVSNRIESDEVVDQVRAHEGTHPVRHGARVRLPEPAVAGVGALEDLV
jgi:hypothetical protein